MKNFISLSVAALFALTSCISSGLQSVLTDVETYIMARPDSALNILETIDRTSLRSEKIKAHHSLLLSMALDKNYVDVADDSLSSVAVQYFRKHGSRKNYARSLYYNGLVYYYQEDYENAIVEFTKAEHVAETSDSLYLGMIKIAQADTYSKQYNDIEELESLRAACHIFDDISADYYKDVARYRLARQFINQDQMEKADSIYSILFNTADLNPAVYGNAMIDYAYMKVKQIPSDPKTALEVYDIIAKEGYDHFMVAQDYWAWAYAHALSGNLSLSGELASQLKEIDSSYVAKYWQYRISKAQGNKLEALAHLEATINDNYDDIEIALKQSLASSQRDYYNAQAQLYRYESDVKTISLLLFISVSALLITLISVFAARSVRREREEKEKVMECIEEINRQFSVPISTADSSLKGKFISLYKSRFDVLNELCLSYLENEGTEGAEGKLYKRVWAIVEDIRNDKARRMKFEGILDSELDNIMTNIRQEMPKIKEIDFTLFAYLVAGFDLTTISRFMDMSLNNVYAHKRRLRLKIEEIGPLHMRQYLEMMS